MGWTDSTSTVVNQPAPQTDAEREADRLRLLEMQRQNDLAERMLPGQLALIEQQRALIQYQIDHQGDMDELNSQQLKLAHLQIQQQIADAAMQEQLRPEQLKYLQNSNALAMEQVSSLRETTAFQREQNKYIMEEMQDRSRRLAARNAAYSPEEEAKAAAEEARRAARMGAMSEEAANIQLENLKRGNKPTDEQLANINEAIDYSQEAGESDIKKFLLDTQRQIQEETAQAAGLRATDAPAVRLSERAGEEAARQQGQLTAKLGATRAQAKLDYPLAANKLEADNAARLMSLTQGAAEFQSQLRMAAAANRQEAFALPPGVGFAMPATGPSPSLGFMAPGAAGYNPNAFNSIFGNNGSSKTTSDSGSFMSALPGIGAAASGIGAASSGIGSMLGAVSTFM